MAPLLGSSSKTFKLIVAFSLLGHDAMGEGVGGKLKNNKMP